MIAEAIRAGYDRDRAEQMVEAILRQRIADSEGTPFFYRDIEEELEDLYRYVGAAPSGIVKEKAKVLASARDSVAQSDMSLECALFHGYHASLRAHRKHLDAIGHQARGRNPGGIERPPSSGTRVGDFRDGWRSFFRR